ncbi:acyl carrier protein [Oscillospiraceae bacterium 42-9]|jgi:acyl carrier protein
MELKEKLALIEEALDTEEGVLTPETILDEVDSWDSIAALSLIAMMDDNFGKTLSGAELKALVTVGDILTHME